MSYPHAAEDISAFTLYEYKDRPSTYAVGSIDRDRFIEVDEARKSVILYAISLMDGKHSFEDIEKNIAEGKGVIINAEELYKTLKKADLLFEQGSQGVIKSEFETLGLKVFDVGLKRLNKLFSSLSILTIPLYALALVVLLFTVFFAAFNYSSITVGSLFGFTDNYLKNIIITVLIMFFSIFCHELSHAIVASKYGIIPKKLTLSLYLYVSPIVYIKLPGLYTIKPKERILTWGAGITTNMLFACIGLAFSILLKRYGVGENTINILNRFWYINGVFAIVNMCPLMPLDGYFILATTLKIPNLRRGAFNALKTSIRSNKIRFSAGQFLYFVLSVLLMGMVVGKEILSMFSVFVYNIKDGVLSAFWSIRQYVLLGILIVILTTIKRIKSRNFFTEYEQ
jgi:peptidase M50